MILKTSEHFFELEDFKLKIKISFMVILLPAASTVILLKSLLHYFYFSRDLVSYILLFYRSYYSIAVSWCFLGLANLHSDHWFCFQKQTHLKWLYKDRWRYLKIGWVGFIIKNIGRLHTLVCQVWCIYCKLFVIKWSELRFVLRVKFENASNF